MGRTHTVRLEQEGRCQLWNYQPTDLHLRRLHLGLTPTLSEFLVLTTNERDVKFLWTRCLDGAPIAHVQ